MDMTRTIFAAAVIGVAGSVTGGMAQRPAPNPNQMQVVAVVGCVTQDGTNWALTGASAPIVVPTADGKVQTGAGVTAERAKSEPVGKERYRLMNMLDEFGVAQHKGQRVLVKGLVLGQGADRRINLVSFEPIAPGCEVK